jgi:hypothetical protein
MKSGHFINVLPRLGMSNSNQVASGDQWQFWTADVDSPFGHQKVSLLYLNSKAAWSGLPMAATNARKRIEKGSPLYVVVQNSADVARDLPRLKRESGFPDVFTVRELLSKSVARALRMNPTDPAQSVLDEVFVDPDIRAAGKEQKAIETLTRWLTQDSDLGPRIGVLVAPAGVGKTTVGKHCFRELARTAGKWRLPLLVTSDQWAKLADRPNITLWDVWRESLDALYSCSVNKEDLEMFLENGVFLPIFDGFDELCTRIGGQFNASEVLDQLGELLQDTDGRILLTTRDVFWNEVPEERRRKSTEFELLPFNKQQTGKYLEGRFPKSGDAHKREVARNILQSLGSAAYGADHPQYRERIIGVPLIVMLAAECADVEADSPTIAKYGDLLKTEDPLEGILRILFERECERRQIKLLAHSQLRLFEDLAFDFGGTFTRDELHLYAAALDSRGGVGEQKALESHAIVCNHGDRFTLRFEFLADYLAARSLVRRLFENPSNPDVIRYLNQQARGGSLLLDRCVENIRAHHHEESRNRLLTAWKCLEAEDVMPGARSGLLHLILKFVDRESGSGPRVQRTQELSHFVAVDSAFSNLQVQGTIRDLDLRGVTFESCAFSDAGISNCLFDQFSKFVTCKFEGRFEVEECEGFGNVSIERCDFSPTARESIQSQHTAMPVTGEQIRATVRLALERFQRGLGFKSIHSVFKRSGRISRSPICEDVWDALEKYNVVVPVPITGVVEGGLAIPDGRKPEVHNFLQNAMLTGELRVAVDFLDRKFIKSRSR